MEDKLPHQFVEFYVLTIELGGDVRLPVFRNVGKFLGYVYLFHISLRRFISAALGAMLYRCPICRLASRRPNC
jgi:hypothetical protein